VSLRSWMLLCRPGRRQMAADPQTHPNHPSTAPPTFEHGLRSVLSHEMLVRVLERRARGLHRPQLRSVGPTGGDPQATATDKTHRFGISAVRVNHRRCSAL
jgi:hypothetical protein